MFSWLNFFSYFLSSKIHSYVFIYQCYGWPQDTDFVDLEIRGRHFNSELPDQFLKTYGHLYFWPFSSFRFQFYSRLLMLKEIAELAYLDRSG